MKRFFQLFKIELFLVVLFSLFSCSNLNYSGESVCLTFRNASVFSGYSLTVKLEENGYLLRSETKSFQSTDKTINFLFKDILVDSKIKVIGTLEKDNIVHYRGVTTHTVREGLNNLTLQLEKQEVDIPQVMKQGILLFDSKTASVSEQNPIQIVIKEKNKEDLTREISITKFPTEVKVEPGDYKIRIAQNNKEEFLYLDDIPNNADFWNVQENSKTPCKIIAEPNKVYYVSEKGDDTNIGTRVAPYATVSNVIKKIENDSGFNFIKGSNLEFIINISGKIEESTTILIKKGYKVTIRGTDSSKDILYAVHSNGKHRVMFITEDLGQGSTFQSPTTVILSNITISNGKNNERGTGIELVAGTLILRDGIVIKDNDTIYQQKPVKGTIYINPQETAYDIHEGGRKTINTKLILDGYIQFGEGNNIAITKNSNNKYKSNIIKIGSSFNDKSIINITAPNGLPMYDDPVIVENIKGYENNFKILQPNLKFSDKGKLLSN